MLSGLGESVGHARIPVDKPSVSLQIKQSTLHIWWPHASRQLNTDSSRMILLCIYPLIIFQVTTHGINKIISLLNVKILHPSTSKSHLPLGYYRILYKSNYNNSLHNICIFVDNGEVKGRRKRGELDSCATDKLGTRGYTVMDPDSKCVCED